jgi:hypothetical protein
LVESLTSAFLRTSGANHTAKNIQRVVYKKNDEDKKKIKESEEIRGNRGNRGNGEKKANLD